MLAQVLWWCVPCILVAFLLCSWCVACKYGSISRFKGVLAGFVGFVWVCVAWVLCVACVAFVCVRCLAVLGLVACLPCFLSFRFLLLSSCPAFASSPAWLPALPAFLLFGFVACSGFLFGGCCFLFPYGLYAKRKGAPCWCVLSSCVVCCCYAFANCSRASCHTFSASSGVSPQLFQCWRLAPK